MLSKLIKSSAVVLFFVGMNVWSAPDPGLPGEPIGVKYHGNIVTSIQPVLIKFGSNYLIQTNSPIAEGGIFGIYNKNAPNMTTMAISFPFKGASDWNYFLGVGMYFIQGGIYNILSDRFPFVVNENYPFSWQPDAPGKPGGYMLSYNGVTYESSYTPNLLGDKSNSNNPRGAQVQGKSRNVLAAAIIAKKSLTAVSLDVYYPNYLENSQIFERMTTKAEGAVGAEGTFGLNKSTLNILPAIENGSIDPLSAGVIGISSQKVLTTVPAGCEIVASPSGVACPISTSGSLEMYSLKSTVAGVSFLVDGALVPVTDTVITPQVKLFMSADWIDSQLGSNEQVVLVDSPLVSLYPNQTPQFIAPFPIFTKLTINRINYQISITERNPGLAVDGYYQGTIGSNSAISIPYTVKQSGPSKATNVTMSVTGDTATQDSDGRAYCKFTTDSKPAQFIAVPLALAFSGKDGVSRQQVDSDCSGTESDITGMPWTETLGTPYMGELWVDLLFNLSSRRILTDINDNYWAGSAKATGNIKVTATWND
ncbi:hypothetical protein [Solimicrobium silvestre]|uniref:Uncharacterized protein n=1 Tax=Solimicrobium silvestre TaxID=2099400 RepID=A0A2S9GUN4_9BURK|nr:hypothetical protein [Solimicrobium silvestre]PRC91445.1 hypothetical protein S2091_3860 [Solimicrobium silvestre]